MPWGDVDPRAGVTVGGPPPLVSALPASNLCFYAPARWLLDVKAGRARHAVDATPHREREPAADQAHAAVGPEPREDRSS